MYRCKNSAVLLTKHYFLHHRLIQNLECLGNITLQPNLLEFKSIAVVAILKMAAGANSNVKMLLSWSYCKRAARRNSNLNLS